MIVFPGSQSPDLAWEVSKNLDVELGKIETKKFPDQEIYCRIKTPVKGLEAIVIQSLRTSDDLVELILLLETLRDAGAHQIHCVTPYLTYMRQDKRFNEGESLSAKTILKLLDEFSDSLTTINCHFLNHEGEAVYNNIRFTNLDATKEIAGYFNEKLKNPVLVAPDKGAMGFAKQAAEILGCEFFHIEKERISPTEVRMTCDTLRVRNKDVLMIDDIISTGGTIRKACEMLKGCGSASINVAAVHGIFLNGVSQFKGVVDRLASTNTLQSSQSKISVSELISQNFK